MYPTRRAPLRLAVIFLFANSRTTVSPLILNHVNYMRSGRSGDAATRWNIFIGPTFNKLDVSWLAREMRNRASFAPSMLLIVLPRFINGELNRGHDRPPPVAFPPRVYDRRYLSTILDDSCPRFGCKDACVHAYA